MLNRLQIKDFQGIANADLNLSEVNVITGRNGHGKTSVGDAIAFALLGEPLRGENMADVIRYGRKGAEVALTVDDNPAIARKVNGKTSTRSIGTAPAKADAFDVEVRRLVGDPRAIRAVLTAGGLLGMKPAELQRFLVDLSGGELDADAIARAFGADLIAVAKANALGLPTALGDPWRKAREAAEAVRTARWQDLDRAKASVQLAPAPEGDEQRKVSSIEKAIASLEAQLRDATKLEAASSADTRARKEEKIKALNATSAQLSTDLDAAQKTVAALPTITAGRTSLVIDGELAEKRKQIAKLVGEVAVVDNGIRGRQEIDTPSDADVMLAKRLGEIEKQLQAAREVAQATDRTRVETSAAVTAFKREAGNVPEGGTCANACAHCVVVNANDLRAKLEKELVRLTNVALDARTENDKADGAVMELDAERAAAAKAKVRVDAAQQLVELQATQKALDTKLRSARGDEARLVAEQEAARSQRDARDAAAAADKRVAELEARIATTRAELATVEAYVLPEPPATKSADVQVRLDRERAALTVARARDELDAKNKIVEDAHGRWKAADQVTKALGQDGAIKGLVAQVVGPFLQAANEALALLAPDWTIGIDPDAFGFVVEQPAGIARAADLSRGSRWRLLGVLQFAVAKLAAVPLVVFDEIEALDEQGADGLHALVAACVDASIQVIVLSHLDPTDVAFEGASMFTLQDGAAAGA